MLAVTKLGALEAATDGPDEAVALGALDTDTLGAVEPVTDGVEEATTVGTLPSVAPDSTGAATGVPDEAPATFLAV